MNIPEVVNQKIDNTIVKMTNNDLHNTTQKTRDWVTRIPQKKKEKGVTSFIAFAKLSILMPRQ